MDTGLINFIESFKDSISTESYTYIFNVNCIKRDTNPNAILDMFDFIGATTITLDKEDLNYLYNKYYPKYKEEVIKRDEELKLKKEKEIKLLEDKLNKLRDEQ